MVEHKPMVILTFQTLDSRTLRDVLAALSENRDRIADHYEWRPRVNCEGPYFGLTTDPLPVDVAADIIAVVEV